MHVINEEPPPAMTIRSVTEQPDDVFLNIGKTQHQSQDVSRYDELDEHLREQEEQDGAEHECPPHEQEEPAEDADIRHGGDEDGMEPPEEVAPTHLTTIDPRPCGRYSTANGTLVAPRDAWLGNEQLAHWREVEAKYGIKNAATRTKKKPALQRVAPVPAGQNFVPADEYKGKVRGYVYGTGAAGLGYHRDVATTTAAAADVVDSSFDVPTDSLEQNHNTNSKTKKRDGSGRRIRKPTRKRKCQLNYDGSIPAVGKMADDWAP